MSPPRVWLITGASQGFGLTMARCALSHGDKVVATMRRLEAAKGLLAEFPSSQLVAVELDVTKKEQIRPAFMIGKAHFGRIDVVFNNAGYVVGGELETIPDDTARTAFEVNFWGAVHISQEAIRFFREENTPQGGHLIQNSAVCGIMGLPILGMYAASKHALEGFTDCLAFELPPSWNIKITSVKPGGFRTDILSHVDMTPQTLPYADASNVVSITRKSLLEGGQDTSTSNPGWSDPVRGVEKIWQVTTLSNPPQHLPLGKDAVKFMKDQGALFIEAARAYESWSDDLVA